MIRSTFFLAAACLASVTAEYHIDPHVLEDIAAWEEGNHESPPERLDQLEFVGLVGDLAAADGPISHYGNPAYGCEPDETPFSIMGISGSICSPLCSTSPCPTDVPDGVTAQPNCALQNRATGDKFCALICSPGSVEPNMLRAGDSMCGPSATCQPIQGTGICTY